MKNRGVPDADKELTRMAALCARSEQCTFDIREKLLKKRLPSADISKILDYLHEGKYIDDGRFARAYANDKVRFSGWGRYKIRMGLAAKRIPSDLIFKALEGIDEEEYRLALERVAKAKAAALDLQTREDRVRLYRHLLSRGFESDKVMRMLKSL